MEPVFGTSSWMMQTINAGFPFGTFELDSGTGAICEKTAGRGHASATRPCNLILPAGKVRGPRHARELRERLWPEDTFVDFDHGLNTAVNQIRIHSGIRLQTPIHQTLPRKGYRFHRAGGK